MQFNSHYNLTKNITLEVPRFIITHLMPEVYFPNFKLILLEFNRLPTFIKTLENELTFIFLESNSYDRLDY